MNPPRRLDWEFWAVRVYPLALPPPYGTGLTSDRVRRLLFYEATLKDARALLRKLADLLYRTEGLSVSLGRRSLY